MVLCHMAENQAHSHLVINSPTYTFAVTAEKVLKIMSVHAEKCQWVFESKRTFGIAVNCIANHSHCVWVEHRRRETQRTQ